MQVLQPHQQLLYNDCNIVLGNVSRLHQVGTAPAAAKLHDNPQVRALEIGAKVLGDVGRVEFGQDADFLNDVVDFVLCVFDVDDLDRNGRAGTLVDAFVDFAEGASACDCI
jgi:hypothetical protein